MFNDETGSMSLPLGTDDLVTAGARVRLGGSLGQGPIARDLSDLKDGLKHLRSVEFCVVVARNTRSRGEQGFTSPPCVTRTNSFWLATGSERRGHQKLPHKEMRKPFRLHAVQVGDRSRAVDDHRDAVTVYAVQAFPDRPFELVVEPDGRARPSYFGSISLSHGLFSCDMIV